MLIRSFRDLIVWSKAMDLVVMVYRLTELLPRTEQFGLVVQMRKAAISIPSNLSEGHERRSRGDYRRHVSIAIGSLAELETQAELLSRLGYVGAVEIERVQLQMAEVGRMLGGLFRRLASSP
ncbi:MAG: four helix bundle protein [Gemmatimonadales bacterium]